MLNFKNIDEKKLKLIQFVSIFGLLTISYYLLAAFGKLNNFSNYFAVSEVKFCGPILKHYYHDLVFADNFIMVPQFRVNVNFGCDGTEPIFIFIFAVIAYPSTILKKIPAIIIGSFILYSLNLIRICALFVIGYQYKNYMDTFHNDIFPFAFIIIEFGLWLLWINWMNRLNVSNISEK